jgi:hypothetical protein
MKSITQSIGLFTRIQSKFNNSRYLQQVATMRRNIRCGSRVIHIDGAGVESIGTIWNIRVDASGYREAHFIADNKSSMGWYSLASFLPPRDVVVTDATSALNNARISMN